MKQILILLTVLISFTLQADPWEDISKDQAKQIVKYLKKYPIVLDYCDCCDDSKDFLLRILETNIVPCSYDEAKKSVKVRAIRIGQLDRKNKGSAYNVTGLNDTVDYTISINYTFVYTSDGNWAVPFSDIIPYRLQNEGCKGATYFPDPLHNKKIKDNFYINWYNKFVKIK